MDLEYEKITRGVEIILPEDSFKAKIDSCRKEGRPLKVKLGFDPTAPDLHLGHFVVLKKMRDFQELGHEIHIIIGSFTAMIGDPTGKNKTRPPLSSEEINKNAKTYIDQLGKVLDIAKVKVHFNNKWFDKLAGEQIYELLSKYTLNRLLTREDFNNRIQNKTDIFAHELLYPILQGYDSVEIDSDIEIGGTDQLFNMQVGRHLQEAFNKKPQYVMCMPLLRGLDGEKKMSKSLNNYIGLLESQEEVTAKILSIPDSLIAEYVMLLTDLGTEEKAYIISTIAGNELKYKELIALNMIKQLL